MTLLILMQLQFSLVMTRDSGHDVRIPVSMSYDTVSCNLYLNALDTVEVYPLTRVTKTPKGYLIELDRGIVVISEFHVYLFYYYSRRELYFNRNQKEWWELRKKMIKKKYG